MKHHSLGGVLQKGINILNMRETIGLGFEPEMAFSEGDIFLVSCSRSQNKAVTVHRNEKTGLSHPTFQGYYKDK